MPYTLNRPFALAVCGFLALLSGCSGLVSTMIRPTIGNLQQQTDIDLVCQGAPAYLLMIDSLLVEAPQDHDLLLSASQGFSAYTAALEECAGAEPHRLAVSAGKARDYGRRLLRCYLPGLDRDGEVLERELARLGKRDVPGVFWGAFGWLTWVKLHRDDPEAIADSALLEQIMARLLELDEGYQAGAIHLFFGGYYAAKPALLGGRPDLSRYHFERALALANRRFLLTQVTYAATLARATYDRELHDRLLAEVLAFPLASAPEYGLSNHLAVNRARRLLAEDYFAE